jgi:hypothetical protein
MHAPRSSTNNKQEAIRRLRLGDIKKLLLARYGHTLPDDDAGLADLELMLDCVSFVPNARFRMKNIIEVWAPWMDSRQSFGLTENVLRKPDHLRKITATELGNRLNLTWHERQKLTIRTIAPANLTHDEFEEKRREQRKARARARQSRKRRKAGICSRISYLATSLSKQQPWKSEGISRRTWEREIAPEFANAEMFEPAKLSK